MKKTYKILAGLIALSSVLSMNLSAQLSGLYTISSASATGGTNFQSFSALAAVINTAGISGPVTIDVVANTGPYVEQVQFLAITGTSASNTITINGNGNTITFGGGTTTNPHTILLSGTDYLTVNSLTIQATNSTNAMAVHLWNQSDNNSFNNCRIETPINSTGAKVVPYSISGSINVVTTLGNCGNNNVLNGCTVVGGSRGVSIYGNSTIPYNTGNQIVNCNIYDFYQYGIYNYYNQYTVNRGNLFQRLNQTTFTTTYAIYMSAGCYPATIEKNKMRRMFDGNNTSTSAFYGIRIASSAISGSVNVYSNNLISDITSNGTIYGIYDGGYTYNNIYNNSIVLDNTLSTGGTVYGIISYASNSEIRNNLVSINRTGTGTKSCLYLSGSFVCNNNILFNNSPSGTNYVASLGGTGYSTLAAWIAATNYDGFSASGDPLFANPSLYDYTPTVAALNNVGAPGLGINTDINNLARNLPAPDAGAFEFFNQPCSTVSGTNAVITPTGIICPTALTALTLANSYTVNGLTFNWQNASNLIGPYTPISGATLAAYVTPTLNANTYYNVIIGCVNGGTSVTATAGLIQVAGTTTNTPPYFEGFEGISVNKELPNCSWSRSDNFQAGSQVAFVNSWRSARTGNKFAEFDCSNNVYAQTRYFYSNGIYLNAGVTYSASVWYNTPGYSTWYNLALMYGPSQSPAGLVQLDGESNPSNSTYEALTNTFSVTTSGMYYLAVKATENYYASQLVWDDLEITIPCSIASNGAPVVVTGASTVCAGQPVSIAASGAGTYTWNTGSNSNAISPSPAFNTTYSVTGTNTLSGCSTTVVKNIVVHQLPAIAIAAFDTEICPGESVTLYGTSANSYTWSEGPAFTTAITVAPQTTTTYTVLGSNSFGCVGTAVQQIVVNPAPVITVTGNTLICEGAAANLSASGANSFEWKSSNLYLQSPVVSISPMVTTAYTLTGVDGNNCKGTTIVIVAVDPCTGLQNINGTSSKVSVYPNPNNGSFTVELNNGLNKTIEVVDVTGRVVFTANTNSATSNINIQDLSNGVYYIKVKSDNLTEVLKVVKQ